LLKSETIFQKFTNSYTKLS